MRLRFAGFGGQGVVLCGYVFGRAAMLDGLRSIHTQSYGSASRGGLTRSDVTIQQAEIYDLVPQELDVLVAMSQQSYTAFRAHLKEGGLLFYESDLVTLDEHETATAFGIAATDLAFKTFGRKIIANMVMMGYVNSIAKIVTEASLQKTVIESVPAGTEELNTNALEEGARIASGITLPENEL